MDVDATALAAERYKMHPASYMGPLYIGSLSDFFFLGIFFNQLSHYYSCYKTDQIWIRRLVVVTTVLSVYKSIPSLYLIWDKNILNFDDWVNAARVSWPIYTEASAYTLVNTTAQTFFAWRCFTLTGRNWYILLFLGISMLTVLGLSGVVCFYYAVDSYNENLIRRLGIPMMVLGFIIDAVITITVTYQLTRHRGLSGQKTDNLLRHLLSITWEAAIPPVVTQIINVFPFAFMIRDNNWHLLFNMLTPRLYVFSLMYTLNSRMEVRQTASASTSKQHDDILLSSFRPRNWHSTRAATGNSISDLHKTETHLCTLPGEPAYSRGTSSIQTSLVDAPSTKDRSRAASSGKSLDWSSPHRPSQSDLSQSNLSFSL